MLKVLEFLLHPAVSGIIGLIAGGLVTHRFAIGQHRYESRHKFRAEMNKVRSRIIDGADIFQGIPLAELAKRHAKTKELVRDACAAVSDDIPEIVRPHFQSVAYSYGLLDKAELEKVSISQDNFDGLMDYPDEVATRHVVRMIEMMRDMASGIGMRNQILYRIPIVKMHFRDFMERCRIRH